MGPEPHGTTLRAPQTKLPSCQRKLASRIGLSADIFQTLDSGFRLNDDVFRGFFLKVVPLGPEPISENPDFMHESSSPGSYSLTIEEKGVYPSYTPEVIVPEIER